MIQETRKKIPGSPLSLSVLAQYRIVPYNETLKNTWDNFVENNSVNGTFLHTRKFYAHNPLNSQDDKSYLFYKKNRLMAVIGCTLQSTDAVLVSHLRSTCGGFIVSRQVDIEASLAIVQLFLEETGKYGIKQIIIKNPFRIFFRKPCDDFDYALWYFGFTTLFRELEIAIPVDRSSKIETDYSEGTRSGLHKAQKTLSVEESSDYKTYWALLEKTLKERHNIRPVHSYEQFCSLLEHVGTNKIRLFVVRKENELIAGLVLFLLNDICVHAQYIAYDFAFQNERPLNILLHEVSIWAQKNGYQFFNLGRANEDNGKTVNFNLFKFKESYGGRGVLRETLHLKL